MRDRCVTDISIRHASGFKLRNLQFHTVELQVSTVETIGFNGWNCWF